MDVDNGARAQRYDQILCGIPKQWLQAHVKPSSQCRVQSGRAVPHDRSVDTSTEGSFACIVSGVGRAYPLEFVPLPALVLVYLICTPKWQLVHIKSDSSVGESEHAVLRTACPFASAPLASSHEGFEVFPAL